MSGARLQRMSVGRYSQSGRHFRVWGAYVCVLYAAHLGESLHLVSLIPTHLMIYMYMLSKASTHPPTHAKSLINYTCVCVCARPDQSRIFRRVL